MKEIKPIVYRKGGENQIAKFLDAKIIYDNLQSNCTFYWSVKNEIYISGSSTEETSGSFSPGIVLDEGNLSLGGLEYNSWDGSNNYAYTYIASELNLELISNTTASLEE
jgi:hypothetical protein